MESRLLSLKRSKYHVSQSRLSCEINFLLY